jgi:hypothetical protein
MNDPKPSKVRKSAKKHSEIVSLLLLYSSSSSIRRMDGDMPPISGHPGEDR